MKLRVKKNVSKVLLLACLMSSLFVIFPTSVYSWREWSYRVKNKKIDSSLEMVIQRELGEDGSFCEEVMKLNPQITRDFWGCPVIYEGMVLIFPEGKIRRNLRKGYENLSVRYERMSAALLQELHCLLESRVIIQKQTCELEEVRGGECDDLESVHMSVDELQESTVKLSELITETKKQMNDVEEHVRRISCEISEEKTKSYILECELREIGNEVDQILSTKNELITKIILEKKKRQEVICSANRFFYGKTLKKEDSLRWSLNDVQRHNKFLEALSEDLKKNAGLIEKNEINEEIFSNKLKVVRYEQKLLNKQSELAFINSQKTEVMKQLKSLKLEKNVIKEVKMQNEDLERKISLAKKVESKIQREIIELSNEMRNKENLLLKKTEKIIEEDKKRLDFIVSILEKEVLDLRKEKFDQEEEINKIDELAREGKIIVKREEKK